jgi:FkbM family methyltransferase
MIKLSILVPYISRHKGFFNKLKQELYSQILPYEGQVELLSDDNEFDTTGKKRNRLLEKAQGEWVIYFDADDNPSSDYIRILMDAVEADCDCASLKGMYSVDGKDVGVFEHSIKYKEWRTTNNYIKFERYPTPLNLIRSSIAKRFKFLDIFFGEDHAWSKQIHESGLLKTEHYIPEIIYNYKYITNKMKYSQGDEEAFILDFFSDKPNGKFLDIGAYDVFRFSNTRRLYELGWEGILVEPAPQNYKAIADHYAGDERIKVLNVAIGETNGEIDFYESDGDAVSTSDLAHMKKWGDAGVKYSKIKVPQISVVDFVGKYAKDADFLSIDTESTNMVVFRNIPEWVFEQISLLCIEHDGHHEEIEEKLEKYGFMKLYLNAENIILGK